MKPSDCEHVAGNPILRAWYAQNPSAMCAACALRGRPWLVSSSGRARAWPEEEEPRG